MKYIDIAPYPCRMEFTEDRAIFTKHRTMYTSEPLDVSTIGGCASDFEDGAVHIVGVFDGSHATLAHELAHVVIKVLARVNIPVRPDTSEAFCYLLDHLFDKCDIGPRS